MVSHDTRLAPHRFMFGIVLFALAGCPGGSSPDGGTTIEEGAEGGPCFPNGTCFEGLVCLSDSCVEASCDEGDPSCDGAIHADINPDAGLSIELVWDSADVDLDLHLVKDDGVFCDDATSCFWATCSRFSVLGGPPEWDGADGDTAGDPLMVMDNREGYGPELIEIVTPVDATYTVAVHAYSTTLDNPVLATVRVYVEGTLVHEDARQLAAGHEFWEAAQIGWADDNAVVSPLTNVTFDWTCH